MASEPWNGPHKLQPGYAFRYEGKRWKVSKDDDWEHVVVDDEEMQYASIVGYRLIDGVKHSVFELGGSDVYLAQMEHMTRVPAGASERPALRWTEVSFDVNMDAAKFAKMIDKAGSEVNALVSGGGPHGDKFDLAAERPHAASPGRCALAWTQDGDFTTAKGAKGVYRVLNVGDGFTLTVGSTYLGTFKTAEGAKASGEKYEAAESRMAAEEHGAHCSEDCAHRHPPSVPTMACEVAPLKWSARKKLAHGNIERTAPGGYRVYSAGKASKGRVWVASLNRALIGQYASMDEAMKAANAQHIMSQPPEIEVIGVKVTTRAASVERPAKMKPLAWHRATGGGFTAGGCRANYTIEHVKRPRGQGDKPWCLKLNGEDLGYSATAAKAKRRAQKHEHEERAPAAQAAERAPVLHEELIHERTSTAAMPAPGPEIALPWIKITRDAKSYEAIVEVAKKIGPIDSPPKVYEVLNGPMLREDQEVFVVLVLDLHHQLRAVCEIARGERSSVNVGIEEVVRAAINCPGGRYLYVVHSHPTGDSHASKSDRDLLKTIDKSFEPFANMDVVDHIVVGVRECHSIRENKTYRVKKKG